MRLFQIDAFTDQPFHGNPAAVCILDGERDAAWMQNVAAEMNRSETAFLRRNDEAWSLRWFTPTIEVDLCGHATLASAHALWQDGILREEEKARFETRSGLLTASRDGEWIELDFPATVASEASAPAGVLDALGVSSPLYVGRSRFDYLVHVQSEDVVRHLKPDFARLRSIGARGVIVTSRSTGEFDFVSRYFAPGVGIDEDPATGSAHCTLAPFWSERLGKNELDAYQASARGGRLHIRLAGDRVLLRGKAVTIFRGDLAV